MFVRLVVGVMVEFALSVVDEISHHKVEVLNQDKARKPRPFFTKKDPFQAQLPEKLAGRFKED